MVDRRWWGTVRGRLIDRELIKRRRRKTDERGLRGEPPARFTNRAPRPSATAEREGGAEGERGRERKAKLSVIRRKMGGWPFPKTRYSREINTGLPLSPALLPRSLHPSPSFYLAELPGVNKYVDAYPRVCQPT